ncbi:MAG: hydrogen peroxide-inducible genes activator [Magnetococcales bacterium]|nr:hydrogen peroxide-inducible genes activator [Magnetococcales bacterium]
MNINQLRYVLAVAREKSFSRAAKVCHVSQPSLSVAVKNLEDELGRPLFERYKTAIKVTSRGQRVLEQIKKALEEMERIRKIARDDSDPLNGDLRVGAILTIGPYLFPSMIPAFHALAPRMKLLLEENFTALLTQRLKSGEIDAMFIALPFQEHGVEVAPLYDEPFMAIVPAGHPWQERNHLSGEDLANDDLILLGEGNCFRDQVLDICPDCMRLEATNAGHASIVEGSSLETIRHMVATGVGVSVLPMTSINNILCHALTCPAKENQLIRFVPFRPPAPSRRVALVWRSSFPCPAVMDTLARAIRANPPAGVRLVSRERTVQGEPDS